MEPIFDKTKQAAREDLSDTVGRIFLEDIQATRVALRVSLDPTEPPGLPQTGDAHSHPSLPKPIPDEPQFRIDQTHPGTPGEPEPIELGSAHHLIELISNHQFQNKDGTLTAAAEESIREAVRNRDFIRVSPGQRMEEIMRYINSRTQGARISLQLEHGTSADPGTYSPAIAVRIGKHTSRISY